MTLQDLLYKVNIKRISGNTDIEIDEIIFDSRQATKGKVFVAIPGTRNDGHQFIPQVIAQGISAVVCEVLPEELLEDVVYVQVHNSARSLSLMAINFYDNPASKMTVIGVTGTNGKTTIATLLHTLFTNAGYKTGLLSTVVNKIGKREITATHTTPDAIQLNGLLAEMVEKGCSHCFMEVSSHAIVQQRVADIAFAGGIFTNLTHDHLDFHLTFDAYLQAKKSFFDLLDRNAFALVNIDDRNGKVMVQNTRAKAVTYALRRPADYQGKILENQFEGLKMLINGKEIWCSLVGTFNAYNLLAIYATARLSGLSEEEALTHLSALTPVHGRFEYVRSPEGILAIIDYAHTPDALKNVLETINNILQGSGKIITVVGAGGDRDHSKRPQMARIATRLSGITVLTSDNPRSEDPGKILQEMAEGVEVNKKRNTLQILDRREAIKTACTLAVAGDVVLVAGKGHETYQEVMGVRSHFDDREEVRKCFGINESVK
ncbi:MAG: UDP-N-acetylmuramoyl-L-alanyl-D-glutamate--2,6-diaminopimelate ligase [Lentimicrobiaceae bacterium]|jgi:UDP-N-acetylmuramoyl-L-alanyl-D-glutamate--2,6-diaminopimelate ligase|nr:UDP-N-acetylmuramoyl-L-alanyl-D-glutamate--2,6-diaminopimelate ligase [Lentimicrobiaceae bacterium]MDD4597984.1 UDP-N-acetylmuramoyl-L-alanyl-D-glutamate--2,6-diaminopimelate ligase [Lentimicrobiaceae bacterium]MDY0025975.1 UDP-N-acetylmuramoyl-L-alanyl-D-glutamate--2,6-diaminopimelate ligase [Lentimicrobium sp.]